MSPNRKSSFAVILMTLALLAALLFPIACDDGGDGTVVPATAVPMMPVTPEGSVGS